MEKSTTSGGLIAATLLLTIVPRIVADERPSPEQLLLQYEQAVGRMATVHLEAVEKTLEKNNMINGGSMTAIVKMAIFHDDWRWKIKSDNRHVAKNGARGFANESRSEFILKDQLLTASMSDSINGQLQPVVSGGGFRDNPSVTAFPGGKAMEYRAWRDLSSARVLFGRLPGTANQSLWQVLRDARLAVRPEPEMVGRARTWVLESRGKFGQHSVCLDAEHPGVPRKVEIKKECDDSYDGLTLKELDGTFLYGTGYARKPQTPRRPPPGFGRNLPEPKSAVLKEWTCRVDDVEIEVKQGVPVVLAFQYAEDFLFDDGRHEPDRRSLRVDKVEFDRERWPADAFEFWINVPDGHNVTVFLEANGKIDEGPYEWWKGKVRKKE